MNAVILTLGPRDRMGPESAERVARLAGVDAAAVRHVDNLAELALGGESAAGALAALVGELKGAETVIGCSRPRAAAALLDFARVGWRHLPITWVALPFDRAALKAEPGVPWFPVIDRSRCSGCGTCSDYCLFSVYSFDRALPASERVRVTSPLHCKTGCPACARLCPEAALIFPFCSEPELNGEIDDPPRRSRDELAVALGEDPMRLLAERRRKKGLIDPDKFGRAEADRIRFTGVL